MDADKEKKVLEAVSMAARKLAARQRTQKEIRDYLKEKGFEPEIAEIAIGELSEYGYINDVSYAASFYRLSREKGWSRRRIEYELDKKGIKRGDFESALEEIHRNGEPEMEETDRETALRTAEKMLRQLSEENKTPDEKFLARVGRRLASLGYDSGTCYYIMGKIRDGNYDQ